MDAFDAGHFQVVGGGGTGNCGDRRAGGRFELADRFGDGFEHLRGAHGAEVIDPNSKATGAGWKPALPHNGYKLPVVTA